MDHQTTADPTLPMERVLYEVKKVIVGQDHLLERLIVALLARGHVLVEGVPGLAKTMTIKTLAASIGGEFKRIQFTPDLVPADLVGTRMYNQKTGEFSTSLGPVFTNLLLADEINRAPAKVQSALLEVMQERHVTIGRETLAVPDPFLVLATQNPIETEGTYALPEAQIDRFMLKVVVGYPSATEEFVIVERMTGPLQAVQTVITPSSCSPCSRRPTGSTSIPRCTSTPSGWPRRRGRPASLGLAELERYITFGASPRASINLILTARALAFVRGRDYALPEDVLDMALDVLRHRIVLSFEALSDDISATISSGRSSAGSPSRSSRCVTMAPSTSTPERILQRLDWQVIRRLDGLLQGDYRSLFYGYGVDFADLREYQPEDDVRYIDWNVTARMDAPYVRAVSRGSRDHRLVPARPEPVGRFRDGARRAPEAGGPDRLRHDPCPVADPPRQPRRSDVLRRAARADDPGPVRADPGPPADQRPARPAAPAERAVHRPEPAARGGPALDQAPLPRLRHLGLHQRAGLGAGAGACSTSVTRSSAVRLWDPREMALPDIGPMIMEDAETGEQVYVDTHDRAFRERFEAAARQRETELNATFAGPGPS